MTEIATTATQLAETQASTSAATALAPALSSLGQTARAAAASIQSDASALASRRQAVLDLQRAIVAAGGRL